MRGMPLSRAMGLRVLEAGQEKVRLSFPLEPNLNVHGTAFGGSLYTAALLAPWGLLWCLLRQRGLAADVVVAASGERFLAPVGDAFVAECSAPRGSFDRSLKVLRAKGRARVEAQSEVYSGGRLCVVLNATFGLFKRKRSEFLAP